MDAARRACVISICEERGDAEKTMTHGLQHHVSWHVTEVRTISANNSSLRLYITSFSREAHVLDIHKSADLVIGTATGNCSLQHRRAQLLDNVFVKVAAIASAPLTGR